MSWTFCGVHCTHDPCPTFLRAMSCSLVFPQSHVTHHHHFYRRDKPPTKWLYRLICRWSGWSEVIRPIASSLDEPCTVVQNSHESRRKYWATFLAVLIRSHCSLIRLLQTARFTHALHCAHSFAHSLTHSRARGKVYD